MSKLLYQEWEDEQYNSNYPFSGNAELRNDQVLIPRSLLIDARLYPIGGGPGQYLSSIVIDRDEIVFIISDSNGELARGSFNPEDAPDSIALTDSYDRPAGVLVGSSGSLSLLTSWAPGTYDFDITQTAFAGTVVIPCPQAGLRGFLTPDGTLFTGDTWLIGEQGVFFTEDSDGAIRVDIAGDPAAKRKFCEEYSDFEVQGVVKSINGLGSNSFGEFRIASGSNEAIDTVLRAYPIEHGIKLELVGGPLQDA